MTGIGTSARCLDNQRSPSPHYALPHGSTSAMHDYYRIAEVSGARRRTARSVPAWAVVAQAMPPAPQAPPAALHLVRALEPERPAMPTLRDEIALDFPSARQALDHARRDFIESEGPLRRLSVDVALTPRELRRSARVPLCVHMPTVCDACGGRGEVWNDPCGGCDGSGTARATRYVVVRVPANTAPGTVLRYRLALPYGPLVRLDVRLTAR